MRLSPSASHSVPTVSGPCPCESNLRSLRLCYSALVPTLYDALLVRCWFHFLAAFQLLLLRLVTLGRLSWCNLGANWASSNRPTWQGAAQWAPKDPFLASTEPGKDPCVWAARAHGSFPGFVLARSGSLGPNCSPQNAIFGFHGPRTTFPEVQRREIKFFFWRKKGWFSCF